VSKTFRCRRCGVGRLGSRFGICPHCGTHVSLQGVFLIPLAFMVAVMGVASVATSRKQRIDVQRAADDAARYFEQQRQEAQVEALARQRRDEQIKPVEVLIQSVTVSGRQTVTGARERYLRSGLQQTIPCAIVEQRLGPAQRREQSTNHNQPLDIVLVYQVTNDEMATFTCSLFKDNANYFYLTEIHFLGETITPFYWSSRR